MPAETGVAAVNGVALSVIESALARLERRPRGQGVALPGVAAQWEGDRRMAGHAVTVTLSTDEGFPHGRKDNQEWWHYVQAQPGPKVVVARLLSREPGTGAACGVLSAHVLKSLGCDGFLTDGYVRDAAQMAACGLLVASRGVTLRHGTPHVVRFGDPVEVFGMPVAPGDFVMAGKEGALAFPAAWLADLPARIREVNARVEPVLDYCRGKRRTAAEIAAVIARYMPQPAGAKGH
jgi:4-hydroxy-4-methyl-2-oxoglutarate aldolase